MRDTLLGLLYPVGMLMMVGAIFSDIIVLIAAIQIYTQSAVVFSAYWIQYSFYPMIGGFAISAIGRFVIV